VREPFAKPGAFAMTTLPFPIFAQAVITGYVSFWMLLYVWHKADLMMRNVDAHDHDGLRHEALRMAVSLSIMCSMIALLVPEIPQDRRLWLAGGASGLWAGCMHAFWLSVNWWRGRTLWKVR
jgi:hypothetical protein